MPTERLVSLAMVLVATCSTLMVWSGQRSSPMWIVSITVAFASLYVTDHKGWIRLTRTAANILALGAAIFFLPGIFGSDQRQLLWVAKLLAVVQMILFLQPKETTRYWQLALLSLGQAVVAAAINVGLALGLFML